MKLRSDVSVAVLEDGAVVLDLETKYFFSVNSSGWAILQMFETGATLDDVHKQCRAWGAQSEDEPSIERCVRTLKDERLVVSNGEVKEAGSTLISLSKWSTPVIDKHKEPLQRVMTSAFDPSIPLAE